MARDYQIARDAALIGIAMILVIGLAVSTYRAWRWGKRRMVVTQFVHQSSKVKEDANQSRETCVICLEDYMDGDVVNVLECEHAFHKSCLMELKDYNVNTVPQEGEPAFTCPICRGGIRYF